MEVRKYLTPSGLLKVAFVFAVFFLFFIAGVSFRQMQTLSDLQADVTTSHKIRIDLERLFSELKEAETAQRGYIITRQDQYLEPYKYAHVRVNKSLLQIRTLVGNDKIRQSYFDSLSQLIDFKFRLLRDNMLTSNRMQSGSDVFKIKMAQEKEVMNNIRRLIQKITLNEEKILQQQEKDHGNQMFFTPLTSLLIVVFSLIVFLFTFLRMNRNNVEKSKLNRSLLMMNETFNYAERIGEIGHWQLDVESRELTFSDNQFLLLGCKPQSFHPTIDNFLEFVIPPDRHKVYNTFEQQNNTAPCTLYYKVRPRDKKIRYLKTVSKSLIDSEGKQVIIGIACDVSMQHKYTVKLEQRNEQLKRSNDELIAFNHIISHDLQEPLRKIQMFISRINNHDLHTLPEDAQMCISKVGLCANRAQLLIDDLLIYSRLATSEDHTQVTDMNLLLSSANKHLAEEISKSNASISSDRLPTIKIVAKQMEQLLINLLSNAIKYQRDGVSPEIKISYSRSEGNQFPKLSLPSSKLYHVIEISDNGIGFDQDYADRIFEIFHRLHDNEKYSGTGIGLAICKKIATLHKGHITASGTTGNGAMFQILLPV